MRVFRFIGQQIKPFYGSLVGMFSAIVCISVANALKPLIVKSMINAVASHQFEGIWTHCILYGILQLIVVGSWSLSDYFSRYESKFRLATIEYFMKRLYTYPYTFFQNQLSGSLAARLGDIFQCIPNMIFSVIKQFGGLLVLISVSLVLLAYVAPIFASIMVAWICFFCVITFYSLKRGTQLVKLYFKEKSKVMGAASDYLSNMLNVKTFTACEFEIARFEGSKLGLVNAANKQNHYFIGYYGLLGIGTSIYMLGVIAFLIYKCRQSYITPGDCALVMMLNIEVMNFIYQISHEIRNFALNWGSVDEALEVLDTVPEIQDRPGAKALQIDTGTIEFQSVDFHYTGMESLFAGTSVTIEGGQKVGLVGYSGGGKTTFINLILRLYEVSDGNILIDGHNIQDITQDSLRHAVGMIPQDPVLFHRTLMENIRYGNNNASDEQVIEAAKQAHAHTFIMELPKGYQSLVGERGIKLSGGQRQRIAIARAILKNAPILILDEATSQLDSLTEQTIQDSLWDLMQDKTTLIIAHRLSTLLQMDRILVFEQGKIVEDGMHTELLSKGGLYKTLWNAQVGGFLPDIK